MKKRYKILSVLLMPMTVIGATAVAIPLTSCGSKTVVATEPVWGYYAANEKDNNWTAKKPNNKITINDLKDSHGQFKKYCGLFNESPDIRITYGDLDQEDSSDNLYLTVFDNENGANVLSTSALTSNLESLEVRISENSKTYINSNQYDASNIDNGYIKFDTVINGTEEEFNFIKTLKNEAKISIKQIGNEETVKALLNTNAAASALAAYGGFKIGFKVTYNFKTPIKLTSGGEVKSLPFTFNFDIRTYTESNLKWGYRPTNGRDVSNIGEFGTEGGNLFYSGTIFNIDSNTNKWVDYNGNEKPSEEGQMYITMFNPNNNALLADKVSKDSSSILQDLQIFPINGSEKYINRLQIREDGSLNDCGPFTSYLQSLNYFFVHNNSWWSLTSEQSGLEKEIVQAEITSNGFVDLSFRLKFTFRAEQAGVTEDTLTFKVRIQDFSK